MLLGIIVFIFYCFCLGCYPLFTPDEGRYSEIAREMVASGDYITPRVNGVAFLDKPVLYYWLQATAIHLFGIKEWALRLFPVLFGVLGCLVTYICGRQLFDRRTGLISACMLATAPLYFANAHYANLDLEVAVLISCTLLFFITGVRSKTTSRHIFLILAYIFAGLAFLTKGLIGLAFPVMIIGLWITLCWQWKLLTKIHLVKGLVLFAIIVIPWYYLAQLANPEFLHYFFVTQQVTRFLSTAAFNNPTPFWFYLPVVLLGFIPWSGFLLQAITSHIRNIWQARHEHQTEIFLLLWVSVIFLFFSIPHSKIITYILPIFPGIALLTGNYLSLTWNKVTGIFVIICINTLTALVLFSLAYYHWLNLPAAFNHYLYTMAIIFSLSTLFVLFCIHRKNMLPLFVVLITCNTLFLATVVMSAKHLNQNSAKPLIMQLKTILQPQDEVANYFKFYQDVPIYLEKRITLVANWKSSRIAYNDNWVRELWYGMPFQNTADWLITENVFWKRWYGKNRMFVFLGENYLSQFEKHTRHYYLIAKHNGILLLSNKP